MSVLALDLGTTTGWAIAAPDGSKMSGTWDLKPSRFDGGGMRFVKFRARLLEMLAAFPITQIYFEEVRRHLGTDAAHVYGGLMAILTSFCEENKIAYGSFPVPVIKKFATGKGNADKGGMMQAVRDWGYAPKDDNEADAIAILHLALDERPVGHFSRA